MIVMQKTFIPEALRSTTTIARAVCISIIFLCLLKISTLKLSKFYSLLEGYDCRGGKQEMGWCHISVILSQSIGLLGVRVGLFEVT